MKTFKALMARKESGTATLAMEDVPMSELMPGDTLVRVTHSTLNYKDGLAMRGLGKIITRYPLIPGIDLAGIVEETTFPGLKQGERVFLNGYGLGTKRHGGYGEYARLDGADLIPAPAEFTNAQTMAIGIAGYTAMLSVMKLEEHGCKPDKGPILVTGAAGGVGGVAIALLRNLGFEVEASSGRPELAGYLKDLGAARVIARDELNAPLRPLLNGRWQGAVDVVGGHTLAYVLASIMPTGIVAACGLAGGMDLPTTVAPFILRGITLAGVNCVDVPRDRHLLAWSRLARDLPKDKLDAMTTHVSLAELPPFAEKILSGAVKGRIVVDIAPQAAP